MVSLALDTGDGGRVLVVIACDERAGDVRDLLADGHSVAGWPARVAAGSRL